MSRYKLSLRAVIILACGAAAANAQEKLVAVEDLVALGFSKSRVVMMNEGHNGLLRSKRCRMVGRLVLPKAHAAGVRHFAVEALNVEFASSANRDRTLPVASEGYLGQADMRELLQAALDLGWTLIAYDVAADPSKFTDPLSADAMNWREDEQAKNLVTALRELPETAKLLVWSGNSHLHKVEARVPGRGPWLPMGKQFWSRSGIEPFSISQTVSVDFKGDGRSQDWVAKYGDQLRASSVGTLGFLLEGEAGAAIDAVVISLDNKLD